jgi:hypothetical protein
MVPIMGWFRRSSASSFQDRGKDTKNGTPEGMVVMNGQRETKIREQVCISKTVCR